MNDLAADYDKACRSNGREEVAAKSLTIVSAASPACRDHFYPPIQGGKPCTQRTPKAAKAVTQNVIASSAKVPCGSCPTSRPETVSGR
jgi:hypothetical protein